LLEQITTGYGVLNYSVTIVAGWDFKRLRSALNNNENLKHDTRDLDDAEIMNKIGYPGVNPEGRFFPDTYFVVKNSSDILLLKRAYDLMQKKMQIAWQSRDPNLYFKNQNEALTAASLIEKETWNNAERPVIAGVIVNRLKKGMLLQIDPTVIYAAGESYSGKITKANLASQSPYNTYTQKGLPPTPIAIPSLASINAAMHPKQHQYLYFVAKNFSSDNSHQFSETYLGHNQAISKAKMNLFKINYFNAERIEAYFKKSVRYTIN
jgi:UPF0755 protein